jgi:hypothetical protein
VFVVLATLEQTGVVAVVQCCHWYAVVRVISVGVKAPAVLVSVPPTYTGVDGVMAGAVLRVGGVGHNSEVTTLVPNTKLVPVGQVMAPVLVRLLGSRPNPVNDPRRPAGELPPAVVPVG